jgi:hypothetical protein
VEGLAALAHALLARAEGPEVLDRLGDSLTEETELHTADLLAVDADIKENGIGDLGGFLLLGLQTMKMTDNKSRSRSSEECRPKKPAP